MNFNDEFKYYRKDSETSPFAFLVDGSQDEYITGDMSLMSRVEVEEYYAVIELEIKKGGEAFWVSQEMGAVTDQLLLHDDEDDLAVATRAEWVEYRKSLRRWTEGAEGFPDIDQRPVRPA